MASGDVSCAAYARRNTDDAHVVPTWSSLLTTVWLLRAYPWAPVQSPRPHAKRRPFNDTDDDTRARRARVRKPICARRRRLIGQCPGTNHRLSERMRTLFAERKLKRWDLDAHAATLPTT